MYKKTTEMPVQVLACYCLFALGITFLATQNLAMSQDKAEAADKTGADKAGADKTETKTTASSQQESSGAVAGNTPQAESTAINNPEKKEPTSTRSAPVVQVGTEAAVDSNSSLNFQSDAFDVVPPGWFAEQQASKKENNLVPFYVIGFDNEQLKEEIESRVQSEINRFVDQRLSPTAHQFVSFSEDEKQKIVRRSAVVPGRYFDGQNQTPVDFYFAHLEFDKPFEKLARTKWIEKRQQSRLVQYGLIAGGSLLLIGFVFGGLRLNSATSGFYQGRLQFFVAIVILGVVAAGLYFGTQIDWI